MTCCVQYLTELHCWAKHGRYHPPTSSTHWVYSTYKLTTNNKQFFLAYVTVWIPTLSQMVTLKVTFSLPCQFPVNCPVWQEGCPRLVGPKKAYSHVAILGPRYRVKLKSLCNISIVGCQWTVDCQLSAGLMYHRNNRMLWQTTGIGLANDYVNGHRLQDDPHDMEIRGFGRI